MSKLRVHDLAGEFGVPSEDVMTVLRAIDVPVRSHLTVLTDDQVARVRARWEREKRALKERAAAPPAAPSRRRKGAAAASAPPVAAPVAEAAGVRRRRRVVEAAPEVEETSVATEVAEQAEVAAPEAPAVETVEEPEVVVEAAPAAPPPPVEQAPPPPPPAPPPQVQRPAPPPSRPSAPPTTHAPRAPERPRPRPIAPGPARPRPVPGSSPFVPPRPVASATPQGSVGLPTRDKQRGGGPGAPPSTQQPGGRKKKGKRGAVDMDEVQQTVFRTMSQMRGTVAPKKGPRREDAREEIEAARQADIERERKTVRVNEFITVSELADILKVPATQIVGFAFKNLGLMVTINQRLDFDQIELIAGEFGFQAVREEEYKAEVAEQAVEDKAEDLQSRPPVVTIMGHVDHGKTSLLDYIRKANVVAGESGGITQHIGAYHVELPNSKRITFLDTPGHQAFTAMRARGAQVTDIVVLVVAANDSVMPQTIEAISHAKNAGVPLIVAINKVDLPDANPSKVSQDLLQHGVVLEQFGGQTLSTPISAKKGTNISELLDQVLLQSEILDLKANPNRRATGTVIEAQLDPGKGPVATILVQNGTLRVGDDFISGMYSGRVRALLDERGRQVKTAGPAIPVQVLGLTGVPMAGDQFLVVEDS
ncbi:MAG: translation initiation factor IF-2, partial [Gemmatimonadota bacterium]